MKRRWSSGSTNFWIRTGRLWGSLAMSSRSCLSPSVSLIVVNLCCRSSKMQHYFSCGHNQILPALFDINRGSCCLAAVNKFTSYSRIDLPGIIWKFMAIQERCENSCQWAFHHNKMSISFIFGSISLLRYYSSSFFRSVVPNSGGSVVESVGSLKKLANNSHKFEIHIMWWWETIPLHHLQGCWWSFCSQLGDVHRHGQTHQTQVFIWLWPLHHSNVSWNIWACI